VSPLPTSDRGSKRHARGSSISPSVRPSRPSHAFSTAAWISGSLSASRMNCPLASRLARTFHAWWYVFWTAMLEAGAPAAMPSKSSG
jgi:hypothetical protein